MEKFPPGTTLTVTVPQAFAGCHVTFSAGYSYALVAGPVTQENFGDGATCDVNKAVAPPAFTTTEYSYSNCTDGGDGSFSLTCDATVPQCPNVTDALTELRFAYTELPKSHGDKVSSRLHIDYAPSDTECPTQGCTADIPVTISW